jgi:RNA polymerase primary sigma factor
MRNELSARLGREPSDEEVADALRWSTREVSAVTGLLPDATSLDRPVGSEDGGSGFAELLEDERTSEAPDAVIRERKNEQLWESIEGMPDRERLVLVLVRWYGLDDRPPASLAELAAEFGLSRERVRQLQRNAERNLRGRSVPTTGKVTMNCA